MSTALPFWSPLLLREKWMRAAYVMLVVAAVGLRALLRITQNQLEAPVLWEFGEIAINLVETGVFAYRLPGVPTAYLPPAFPILIAGLYKVLGISFAAHVVLALLLWLGELSVCFLIGRIGQLLWSPRVGWIAFVVALVWPNFLIMSGRLHDISIYMALLLLAFNIMLTTRFSPLQRALLTGAVMGVFGLFRFEAFGLLVPFAYYLAFHSEETQVPLNQAWGKRVLLVAALGITFMLPVAPWLVRNFLVFDEPLLSTGSGYNLVRGHHERATGSGRNPWPSNTGTRVSESVETEALTSRDPRDEMLRDDFYREQAIDYLLTHPRDEVRLTVMKLYYFLVADFTHPYARLFPIWGPSLLALVLGFYFWIQTGLRVPEQQIFWMLFGLQTCLIVIVFVLPRYRMLVDFIPVLFMSAWLGTGAPGSLLSAKLFAQSDLTSSEDTGSLAR